VIDTLDGSVFLYGFLNKQLFFGGKFERSKKRLKEPLVLSEYSEFKGVLLEIKYEAALHLSSELFCQTTKE